MQLGFDTPTLAVHVAVGAVEEGTLLQLHLRDSMWAQQGLRNLVQVSSCHHWLPLSCVLAKAAPLLPEPTVLTAAGKQNREW